MSQSFPAASILLAEDDQQLSEMLSRVLRRAGYEVDAVANGRQAVGESENRYFDLLITDLAMPLQDGLETIELIRKSSPYVKILVISGFVPRAVRPIVHGLGADAALMKPFSPGELVSSIQELVGPPPTALEIERQTEVAV